MMPTLKSADKMVSDQTSFKNEDIKCISLNWICFILSASVLGAYKALSELKAQGKAQSIGVGAKDISSIGWISDHIQLDWVR